MDWILNHIGFSVSVLFSVLGAGLGLPLAVRLVPRNALYGFRLGYTMVDDEVWYAVNAKFGMEFTVLGDMCFLVGMASLFLLPDRQGQVLSLLAVCALFGVGILLSLFRGVALMNRMAKEKGLRQ